VQSTKKTKDVIKVCFRCKGKGCVVCKGMGKIRVGEKQVA